MAVTGHPMSALKGTPEGKALMAQVSSHRGGGVKAPAKRDQATRSRQAAAGVAMPDGSYPIADGTQLADAVKDWIRTGRSLTVKAHIQKRAKALGLELPEGMESRKQPDEMDIAKTINARKG